MTGIVWISLRVRTRCHVAYNERKKGRVEGTDTASEKTKWSKREKRGK